MIDYLSFFENAGFKTLPSCTTITLEELDRLNIVFGPHRKAILDLGTLSPFFLLLSV